MKNLAAAKRLLLLLSLFVFWFFLKSPVLAQNEPGLNRDSDRVIVKFRSITPSFLRDRLIKNYGLSVLAKLKPVDTFAVRVPKKRAGEFANLLQKSILVDYAEEDFIAEALETPNDPLFSNQWGLAKIETPGAWDTTHGGTSTDIAIVDTGIDGGHPDLGSKITLAADCTISSSCPTGSAIDGNGHGTHVAGIAGAITNNSLGVAGVSWEGRLMSVKVLDNSGSGYYSWVANGIYWAADNGAEVINLSLGGSASSTTLKAAIDYAWGKGVVIVAAAGNNGSSWRIYPAYYANAIAVAATNQNDSKASFSNYGSWVDVAAPGVSILSTYKGDYAYLSGTSMSTPFVSGLAGLVFGQNPGWSASQVRNQIESTADKISGTGYYWTYGRIDACKAVGCGVTPTPSPSPSPSPTPTPTSTVVPTSTPTSTPTPTPSPTPSPTVLPTPSSTASPTPTPSPKPWWCRYFPKDPRCQ